MPSKMKKRTSAARTRSTPKKTSARMSGRGGTATRSKKTTAKKSSGKAGMARSRTSSTASRSKSTARKTTSQGKTMNRGKSAARSMSTRSKTTGGSKSARAKSGKQTTARKTGGKATRARSASTSRSSTRSGSAKAGKKSKARGARSGSSAITTTDHGEIRKWVESRGGMPSTVSGTEKRSESAGLLRIDFPGYSGKGSLEKVDWDDFFEKFEESRLAFLYDPDKGSRFNKFVQRGSSRRKR